MEDCHGLAAYGILKDCVSNGKEINKFNKKSLEGLSNAENQGTTEENTRPKKRSREDIEDDGGLAADESLKANDFYGVTNDEEMITFNNKHLKGSSYADQQGKTEGNTGLKKKPGEDPCDYPDYVNDSPGEEEEEEEEEEDEGEVVKFDISFLELTQDEIDKEEEDEDEGEGVNFDFSLELTQDEIDKLRMEIEDDSRFNDSGGSTDGEEVETSFKFTWLHPPSFSEETESGETEEDLKNLGDSPDVETRPEKTEEDQGGSPDVETRPEKTEEDLKA